METYLHYPGQNNQYRGNIIDSFVTGIENRKQRISKFGIEIVDATHDIESETPGIRISQATV